MSLHTGTVSRPRTHIAEPQRAALRQQMHGPIRPQVEQRNPMWWRVGRGIVLVSAMYALKLAVVG